LVYGFVPRTSLENTVIKRSEEVSRMRISRVDRTMTLEKQNISRDKIDKIVDDDVKTMVEKMPRYLWD